MHKPKVILICGPSGHGKTTLTKALALETGGIPLHLDSLFGGHYYLDYDNPKMIAKAAGIVARMVAEHEKKLVFADYLFFKKEVRDAFNPDFRIIMRTLDYWVKHFDEEKFDFEVTVKDAPRMAKEISRLLLN